MKKLILLPLFLLLFLKYNFGQEIELSLKLVDHETSAPISYATILMLDNSEVGAVSDSEGNFNLKYPSSIAEARFYISTVGYADTTIVIEDSSLQEGVLNIALKRDALMLDTVSVKGIKPQLFSIGLERRKYKIAIQKSGTPDLFMANREGEMMGNHFEIGKAKIEQLHIYFYKHEKLTDKCLIRFFTSDEEVTASKNKPFSDLTEIGNEPIVVDIDSTGYKTVSLSDYNIIHEGKYLIVLILPYFPPDSTLLKGFPLAIIDNKQKDVNLVYATKGNSYAVFPRRLGSFLIEVDYFKLDKSD